MSNTLAHIAINGIVTRSIYRESNLQWIYVGAIIPDMPWILQHIVRQLSTQIDLLDLRVYVIAQASLFFSLILSFALSALSRFPVRTFSILAFGSLLHLILDASQTKWGNGVHLFAPLNWELLNFGGYWPESILTLVLTISGLLFMLVTWKVATREKLDINLAWKKSSFISLITIMIYLLLPLSMFDAIKDSNSHFVATLGNADIRIGKRIELDRAVLEYTDNKAAVRIFTGEIFHLLDVDTQLSGNISIKGRFVRENVIKVDEYYEHNKYFRDIASYIGLFMIAVIWFILIFKYLRKDMIKNQV